MITNTKQPCLLTHNQWLYLMHLVFKCCEQVKKTEGTIKPIGKLRFVLEGYEVKELSRLYDALRDTDKLFEVAEDAAKAALPVVR